MKRGGRGGRPALVHPLSAPRPGMVRSPTWISLSRRCLRLIPTMNRNNPAAPSARAVLDIPLRLFGSVLGVVGSGIAAFPGSFALWRIAPDDSRCVPVTREAEQMLTANDAPVSPTRLSRASLVLTIFVVTGIFDASDEQTRTGQGR